ncbi:MAG: extracellular solute-binding protein [Clostridia bacterium]|nr:extracellular solute-binding protein [Clostridia bacterium]
MRKLRLVSVLLLTVLLSSLLLTGCHGSRSYPPFEMPETFDTSHAYEISFWAKNDTNKTQVGIYQKAIEDFMALYPNITVNLRLYTDYGHIYNDVITNISTKTTPNVCITYPDHIATYLTGAGTVVPLDELFDDEKYGLGGSEVRFDSPTKEQIVPQFLEECILDGKHYAIPYMRSTEACYVNKTYVEALGFTLPEVLTWDFVWEVSEAALEKDADGNFKVNGQKVLFPFIYKSTDNMMIQMLKQKCAPYSTDAGEIGLFNDTTKEILYTVAEHAKSEAFGTFKILGYPANYLNAGQCIFAVDSTAGATWMGSDAPLIDIPEENLVNFETVVMPIPQYDPENSVMISQGPSVCVFNKSDPGEVLASWLFAQYLLTNDVQIAYAQTEGYVPVTLKAQNSPEYIEYLSRIGEDKELHYDVKIKASELLISHVDDTFVTPVFNGSASLRNAAGQLIENTTKSVRRKQTIDEEYMDALFADITSLYRLDQSGIRSDTTDGERTVGPLPSTSVFLLSVLAGTWFFILLYLLRETIKQRKNKKIQNTH